MVQPDPHQTSCSVAVWSPQLLVLAKFNESIPNDLRVRSPRASPPPIVRRSAGLWFLYEALDTHPFFPPRAVSGHCFLTAAAACVPCGVLSGLAEPSSWRTGVVLVVAGHFTPFAAHSRPHPGRPPHASLRFRVHEAQLLHPSACCPDRPLPASPCCCVREAQLLHLCAWCTWALCPPSWFLQVSCAPPGLACAGLWLRGCRAGLRGGKGGSCRAVPAPLSLVHPCFAPPPPLLQTLF